ncbi:MAG TPA: FAD-binding oxidoreductase [Planctomycetota bacterium]|nr:FAD-binding oxidoreductase [Planctomycetota bacterium]
MESTTDVRTPRSVEELAEIVRAGRPVHAFGSGTKLHHGPASSGAEPVCLRGLDRITAYEPGDLVVCVQAGTRIADLQAALDKERQWLPIDPPYPEATVGGLLATNSSGPRRFGYGTMRDLLIGLTVMGPDGLLTRSGGRVVKNVTGYDLHKLHVGAFGTLGVLVEANFKVRPKPDVSAACVFPCASLADAHALLLKIFDSRLRPVALEAIDGRLRHIVDGKALAIVGVEGSREVLDRHVRELAAFGEKMGVLEGARAEPLWAAIRKLPSGLKDFVRVRLGAKPHDLPRLLPPGPACIQAGVGVARLDLEPSPEVFKKIQQLNERAVQAGGYAVVESAPLDFPNREKLSWGGAASPIMRSLKRARDPKGILNPGRMEV